MACTGISGLNSHQEEKFRAMLDEISTEKMPRDDYSINFTTKVKLQQQDSLWYKGFAVDIYYKGITFSLKASGEVKASLIDTSSKNELISIGLREEDGTYFNDLHPYIKTDKDLELATSNDFAKYELCYSNNNWWEVFVFDRNDQMLEATWVTGDKIFTSVAEALQELDEFIAKNGISDN